ncbi:glycosyl transferase [Microbacterium esteraromaticum]
MRMTRPHLLYTAWSFPPSRAGGVYRALATVNAFVDAGWDVTVLTVPRSIFVDSTGADFRLEEQVRPGVVVVRDEPNVPAYQNDIGRWPWSRARHTELFKLADLRRDFLHFPEPNYGRWRPSLERAAERIHREHRVDLAIGTANPHVDFIPGWHLHRRFGVPYVMDYRDAWQLDVFTGRKLITALPIVDRWEARLMADAAEIWFVNEPIRQWHEAKHPESASRMKVVANGFEEYGDSLAVPVRPGRDAGLVFGYIGTITDKVPFRELVDGWAIARERGGDMATARLELRGYLGHFGTVSERLQADLDRARELGITYAGPVSKADIARAYEGFDALVLALGTGRYVTSGKVYEYAATGLPIAAIHDPGNAATDVLKGTPVHVPIDAVTPAAIATALEETARMAASQTVEERRAAQDAAARYSRTAQLAPRIDALRP